VAVRCYGQFNYKEIAFYFIEKKPITYIFNKWIIAILNHINSPTKYVLDKKLISNNRTTDQIKIRHI
jgi:hypothetical protein